MHSVTKLLGCILIICSLHAFSLAAPTHAIERDQGYTNTLFAEYSCRIQIVEDEVRTKLNVSDQCYGHGTLITFCINMYIQCNYTCMHEYMHTSIP